MHCQNTTQIQDLDFQNKKSKPAIQIPALNHNTTPANQHQQTSNLTSKSAPANQHPN
jgi:hypothetical protein